MELKLEIYKKTVESLSYLANVDLMSLQTIIDPRLIDGIENGLIQKFEIATEQSWKLVKKYLFENEDIDTKTPRQTIKSFYTSGYLKEIDYSLWLQALNDRNILSHRYDEQAYQWALGRMKEYAEFYFHLIEILDKQVD